MATIKGVMAGIGDKETGTNVIQPAFDAKIRDFIVGKSCIIKGLELTQQDNKYVLSSGMCIFNGYVGELAQNTVFDFNNIGVVFLTAGTITDDSGNAGFMEYHLYVPEFDLSSSRFNMKFPNELYWHIKSLSIANSSETVSWLIDDVSTIPTDSATPLTHTESGLTLSVYKQIDEEFTDIYITASIGSNTGLNGNDLLIKFGLMQAISTDSVYFVSAENEVGGIIYENGEWKYSGATLPLYVNGERAVDNNYPEKAVNSDNTNKVIDGGTIGENVTVEGDLPETLVYDKTIATTEFVQKAILQQIGYKTAEIKYYAHYSKSSSVADKQVGIIRLEKKSDFIIATSHRTSTENYDIMPDMSSEGSSVNGGWLYIDAIPAEFRADNMIVMLSCKTYGDVSRYSDAYFALKVSKTTGLVSNSSTSGDFKTGNVTNLLGEVSMSGWKINL